MIINKYLYRTHTVAFPDKQPNACLVTANWHNYLYIFFRSLCINTPRYVVKIEFPSLGAESRVTAHCVKLVHIKLKNNMERSDALIIQYLRVIKVFAGILLKEYSLRVPLDIMLHNEITYLIYLPRILFYDKSSKSPHCIGCCCWGGYYT